MKPTAGTLLVVALLATGGAGVAYLQPKLARTIHDTKSREDVYVLPPPTQLRAMTLGYHAAAADLLWATVLVQYGTHHGEHRPFPDLDKFLDAILAVERDYAPLFKYAEALLVYRPPRGYEQDARTTRRILEIGIHERPYDHAVWLSYGDFLAFVAPSFLGNEDEIAKWRLEGIEALIKAVDLGADIQRAETAAAFLSRSGQQAGAIRQLERVYAVTEDPDKRAEIGAKLDALQASEAREILDRHENARTESWKRELPFLSRSAFLLLGPLADPQRCVGLASVDVEACRRHWYETPLEAAR